MLCREAGPGHAAEEILFGGHSLKGRPIWRGSEGSSPRRGRSEGTWV